MTDTDQFIIELPAELLIRNLDQIQSVLLSAQSYTNIVINGANVSKADTAGLQLLTTFINSNPIKANISWNTPSTTLAETAQLLGLTQLLQLP